MLKSIEQFNVGKPFIKVTYMDGSTEEIYDFITGLEVIAEAYNLKVPGTDSKKLLQRRIRSWVGWFVVKLIED